ncbi:MAG: hypothetical protein FWC60_04410 [Firmicutes bacterium]|nr:hypothetical protein [Bacillota bacterium]
MKKIWALIFVLVLTFSLAGCGGNKTGGANNSAAGGVTLAGMKQAAADKGYKISDGYIKYNDKIVGGFTVDYPNGTNEYMAPVLEFDSPVSAAAYAKTVNEAGYNVCVVNGKYLTMVAAEKGTAKDPDEQTFFANLLNGRDLGAAPTYS